MPMCWDGKADFLMPYRTMPAHPIRWQHPKTNRPMACSTPEHTVRRTVDRTSVSLPVNRKKPYFVLPRQSYTSHFRSTDVTTPPTLQELSQVLRTRMPHEGSLAKIRHSRRMASIVLMLTDAVIVSGVLALVIAVRGMFSPVQIPLASYLPTFALVVLGNFVGSAWRGMYPGYGRCAITELRSTFYTLTGVFAAVIAMSFFTQGSLPFARSILLSAWLLSIPAQWFGRAMARRWMGKRAWYGIPVAIIGDHELSARVVDTLRNNSHIGLRPHVIVETDADDADYGYHEEVPIIGGLDNANDVVRKYGITHGVIAMSQVSSAVLSEMVDRLGQHVSHLTFVGEHVHPSVLWISNVQSDPLLSAEIEQRLRQPALRLKKRLFDIAVTLPLLLLSLPLMAVIAVLIKLTSKGPVLYRQIRIGQRGEEFELLKFRSMVLNADKNLAAILANDPDALREWSRFHKLRRDPRLTRIGSILRKYSIDELPQFWNVLRGDMTLVGSRPLLRFEYDNLAWHKAYISMYTSTMPGLSGLWQVTTRSDVEFDVRIHIDMYYMRNWSIFLDIYILLRTVAVVLTGRGAY
ncbi:MAG: undecaprenyl-phosphate galactose phosphotransferase WbaP [Candidatus Kapabacteria bacterium]|nr:undecaprenyl-phosphate galactose phosphotransferase WbaP [Candidatus Kapabacteria bacterium]